MGEQLAWLCLSIKKRCLYVALKLTKQFLIAIISTLHIHRLGTNKQHLCTYQQGSTHTHTTTGTADGKTKDIFILLGAIFTSVTGASIINVLSSTHSSFEKVIMMINTIVALCTTKPFIKRGKPEKILVNQY